MAHCFNNFNQILAILIALAAALGIWCVDARECQNQCVEVRPSESLSSLEETEDSPDDDNRRKQPNWCIVDLLHDILDGLARMPYGLLRQLVIQFCAAYMIAASVWVFWRLGASNGWERGHIATYASHYGLLVYDLLIFTVSLLLLCTLYFNLTDNIPCTWTFVHIDRSSLPVLIGLLGGDQIFVAYIFVTDRLVRLNRVMAAKRGQNHLPLAASPAAGRAAAAAAAASGGPRSVPVLFNMTEQVVKTVLAFICATVVSVSMSLYFIGNGLESAPTAARFTLRDRLTSNCFHLLHPGQCTHYFGPTLNHNRQQELYMNCMNNTFNHHIGGAACRYRMTSVSLEQRQQAYKYALIVPILLLIMSRFADCQRNRHENKPRKQKRKKEDLKMRKMKKENNDNIKTISGGDYHTSNHSSAANAITKNKTSPPAVTLSKSYDNADDEDVEGGGKQFEINPSCIACVSADTFFALCQLLLAFWLFSAYYFVLPFDNRFRVLPFDEQYFGDVAVMIAALKIISHRAYTAMLSPNLFWPMFRRLVLPCLCGGPKVEPNLEDTDIDHYYVPTAAEIAYANAIDRNFKFSALD